MMFGRPKSACCLALAALVFAAAWPTAAQSPPRKRGRPIQFSEPRSDVVNSNVNQLDEKKTTLKSLEQELKKPFELFSPLDDPGIRFITPPAQRTVPSPARSKRMRELLEKRNDWIFLSPEDYNTLGFTAEDIFDIPEYGPDGAVKKRKTPLERYFERMEKQRLEIQNAPTNQARDEAASDPLEADAKQKRDDLKALSLGEEQRPLSSGLSDLERTAKNLSPRDDSAFNSSSGSENSQGKGLSELFGLGKGDTADSKPEISRALDTRMQEFKQLMDIRAAGAPNSSVDTFKSLFGSAGTAPSGLPGGLDVFSSPATPSGLNSFAPAAVAPPAPSVASPPSSLSLPSWQTPPLAPQTPRISLPPPTFNIPQRKF